MEGPRSRNPFAPVLALAIAATVASAGCKEPPPPPGPPPFSVKDAASKLSSVALDDAFFTTLDELKTRAGSDPEAASAWARFSLAGLGAVLSGGHHAGQRLIGADPKDVKAVGAFLGRIAAEAKKAPAGAQLASAASALAGSLGTGGVSDLSATIALAKGDSEGAAAVRLVLARVLLDGLRQAADMPETDRGAELLKRVQGLPSAPTLSPAGTAFPATLQVLADLLAKGAGQSAGLAKAFEKCAGDAASAFGGRVFPLPVGLGLDPTARANANGLAGGYLPLATLTVKKEGLFAGARPVFSWEGGKASDRTAGLGWPGAQAVAAADLEDPKGPKDAAVAAVKAAVEKAAGVVGPIEAAAFKALAGKGPLNADRKEWKAVLVASEPDVPAAVLGASLSAATAADHGDLRLVQPGVIGAQMPVVYRRVPAVEGIEKPSSKRVIVVVSPQGCDVYAPGKSAEKLPVAGWPEGAKVGVDQKKFFKLSVPWVAGKGFSSVLGKTVAAVREKTGAAPWVDVVVRGKDVTAAAVLDAVAEIEAPGVPTFPYLAAYFGGAECPAGRECLAAVPVLFSDAAVPKPKEPEAVVKETRPAGFCDKGAVQKVVLGRSGAYRSCYEVELQRRPDIAGRVELRFTIEPDGSVSGVTVSASDLANKNVESCLVKQVSGLKFPKPDGGICVIRWPFKFQPGG